MEISPGWVSAGAAVVSLVGGGLVRWVYSAIKDEAVERSGDVNAVKTTQGVLFGKLDSQSKELQEYKLHVAETYVNREILKEQLAPINKTLENIQQELREDRHK